MVEKEIVTQSPKRDSALFNFAITFYCFNTRTYFLPVVLLHLGMS